jgi:hypothetical protein
MPSSWGPDHQLVAPLQGFWKAGHDSDTMRNRRELCMLENAYKDRLTIHHVVFDYRNTLDTNQPLSWDLTPNQENNIRCALNTQNPGCTSVISEQNTAKSQKSIQDLAEDVAQWFRNHDPESGEACSSTGLGPGR